MWEDVLFAVRDGGKGMCCLTSPPYFETRADPTGDTTAGIKGWDYARQQFGSTPGQIGQLPDKPLRMCCLTSPPYEDTLTEGKPLSERQDKTAQLLRQSRPKTYDKTGVGSAGHGYGDSPSNIGRLKARP